MVRFVPTPVAPSGFVATGAGPVTTGIGEWILSRGRVLQFNLYEVDSIGSNSSLSDVHHDRPHRHVGWNRQSYHAMELSSFHPSLQTCQSVPCLDVLSRHSA